MSSETNGGTMRKLACPRRYDSFSWFGIEPPEPMLDEGPDAWREDGTCSFCGSLDPEIVLARIVAGDVELTPTDKGYKTYVTPVEGAPMFKRRIRDCPDSCEEGPSSCPHWKTEETGSAKLYFQHLSKEQQQKFVELYNAGSMKLKFPGYFYRMPFFMRAASK